MGSLLETSESFKLHFKAYEEGLNGERESWVHGLRRKGAGRFTEAGLPKRGSEEWKYLNVTPLAKRNFELAKSDARSVDQSTIATFGLPALAGPKLVLVNGACDAKLTSINGLPDGVIVCGLADALKRHEALVKSHLGQYACLEDHPFLALNTGFISDGIFIYVPKQVTLECPIQVLHVADSAGQELLIQPRNLVVLEAHAKAFLIEHYISRSGDDAAYFTNAATEVVLGAGATLEHCKLQRESKQAYHIAHVQIHQAQDSNYLNHSIVLGAAVTRNDLGARLDGSGGHCTLNGFFLGNGRQVIDNHTLMDHCKPHCNSWEVYKGVLDEQAQGVFNGKIYVHQGAQKTDAKQSNKNLLLSDGAEINTKPQLQIYADDVKCTHGATIGRLDKDALYYLRCRGIGEAEAQRMLTAAFAGEVIQEIRNDVLREYVDGLVQARMKECPGLSRR